MADDIKVNPSLDAGAPAVATDEVGGKHYQKVKSGWGADGTWNETADTPAARLPVASTNKKSASVAPAQVAVGTSAGSVLAANANRLEAVIRNIGNYSVYLGQSGVTTSTGFELRPGETFVDDRTTQQWFGIASGGSSTVCVMEA